MARHEEYFGAVGSFANTTSTDFNGTTQYVDLTGSPITTDQATAHSVSFWFKILVSQSFHVPIAQAVSSSNTNLYIILETSTDKMYNWLKESAVMPSGWDDGDWHHGVYTHPAGGAKGTGGFYIDSVKLTTVNQGGNWNTNTTQWTIGSQTAHNFLMGGRLDEISIWDKALSDADVVEIYNSGTPDNLANHTSVANLLAWLRMGEGDTYPTITDIVGGFDGTMVNMSGANFVNDTPP